MVSTFSDEEKNKIEWTNKTSCKPNYEHYYYEQIEEISKLKEEILKLKNIVKEISSIL